MARKYQIEVEEGIEVKSMPAFIEAGPATVRDKMDQISHKIGADYDVTEDPDDYIIRISKRAA